MGLDISSEVLKKAKILATEDHVPSQGPESVIFEEGNVLKGLPYPDETFDIVYCSQLFGHLHSPDLPLRALAEMRLVLKKGSLLATRDAADLHFYPPRGLGLDRFWVQNSRRGIHKDARP